MYLHSRRSDKNNQTIYWCISILHESITEFPYLLCHFPLCPWSSLLPSSALKHVQRHSVVAILLQTNNGQKTNWPLLIKIQTKKRPFSRERQTHISMGSNFTFCGAKLSQVEANYHFSTFCGVKILRTNDFWPFIYFHALFHQFREEISISSG